MHHPDNRNYTNFYYTCSTFDCYTFDFMKWTLIRNPMASGGKSLEQWPAIRDKLVSLNIEFEDLRTQYQGHATILAREAIKNGARHILAMGGDGTVNEVANGILGQSSCPSTDILLTQIPIGVGNDWSRSMGIPHKLSELGNLFQNGTTIIQDVGLVSWNDETGHPTQRYFVNMAGMGFDAYVSKAANDKKAKGKKQRFMGYISSLMSGLWSYETTPIDVKIDNQSKGKYELFSLSVGICKYSGGGMLQCPDAIYDDGLLDLTVIDKMSKLTILINIPKLFNGRFVKNQKVHQFRGHSIDIIATKDNLLEVDGEVIGSGSAVFQILPKQLKVLGLK